MARESHLRSRKIKHLAKDEKIKKNKKHTPWTIES